jgi:hypothetical protein
VVAAGKGFDFGDEDGGLVAFGDLEAAVAEQEWLCGDGQLVLVEGVAGDEEVGDALNLILDGECSLWEIPIMASGRKLDSRRRCVFPDQFSPGDLFVEESLSEDSVTFRLVKPTDVPVVGISRRRGRAMVKVPVDRDRVRQALRDERDAR